MLYALFLCFLQGILRFHYEWDTFLGHNSKLTANFGKENVLKSYVFYAEMVNEDILAVQKIVHCTVFIKFS